EVAMRKLAVHALGHLLRHRDRRFADLVSDAARSGVQHDPHRAFGVEAELHEVVPAAKRPQLAPDALALDAPQPLEDAKPGEAAPEVAQACPEAAPGLERFPVEIEAHRDIALDLRANLVERLGKVLRREARLHGEHSATDVHAHRRGHDRGARRDHGADGGTLSEVHVGHDRDGAGEDRQQRHLADLLHRLGLDGEVAGPEARVGNAREPRAHRFAIASAHESMYRAYFASSIARMYALPDSPRPVNV